MAEDSNDRLIDELIEAGEASPVRGEPSPQPSPLQGEGEGLIDSQWQAYVWKEFPGLRCVKCLWDTLDGIDAARAYQATCGRCAPEPPYTSSGMVLVADKSGREVTTG